LPRPTDHFSGESAVGTKIELEPKLPTAIRDRWVEGKLVLFLGAGVSAQVGLPLWEKLADWAMKQVLRVQAINYDEYELIARRLLAPRIRLSIAIHLFEKKTGVQLSFDEQLDPDEVRDIRNLEFHRTLLGIRSHCITTNYDRCFDRASIRIPRAESIRDTNETYSSQRLSAREKVGVEGCIAHPWKDIRDVVAESNSDTDELVERVFYKTGVNHPDKLPQLLHLHGHLDDPKRMVLTTKDYLELYSQSRVQDFLESLFRHRTVLFVGYGLADIEILDHVFRKTNVNGRINPTPEHFWLFPVYGFEEPVVDRLQQYYSDHCNVDIRPFSMKEEGHDQLRHVLKAWIDELRDERPTLRSQIGEIEEAFR
jgi:hypothetical protein